MHRISCFSLIAAAVLIAACSNSGVSNTAMSPGVEGCTSVTPPVLLYPKSGAAGIPAAHLTLYFAYPNLPSAFAPPTLTPSNGSGVLTGGPYAVPSPGPTPAGSATPPPGDQVFVSEFTPGAASATTYTVTVNNTTCGPFTEGTFTTQ